MKNKYEIRGDVTAIFINRPKHGNMETLISTSKLEKVKQYGTTWFPIFNHHTKSFYAVCVKPVNGKISTIRLNRMLLDAPTGMLVDHINHETLDNTDTNLRIVSNTENLQNLKGARTDSKSGILGVSWSKHNKKWRCQMKVNKKFIFIGYFSDIEDAEKAIIEARRKHMPYSQEAL